ncbi:unnamed protein product [Rotaria socialis]|uniref:Uncharacterized protein n=1 Tax=Rotaria socialis TaxID=392032 RepID=A0A821UDH2_9BILA|nr:unnamed protein product [Rotaria socialis]
MTELTNQAQQQQTSEKKDLTYWNSQWCSNKVGFHRLTVNHGKTIDMKAVLDSKHQVIGIECAQVGPPHSVSDEDAIFLFGSICSIESISINDTTADFIANSRRKVRLMEEHLHLIIRK